MSSRPFNFSHSYSVILHHPISTVFTTLGTATGHKRVCCLSPLCVKLDLLDRGTVALPPATPLSKASVRTQDPVESDFSDNDARRIDRQHFVMHENIPLLFGLVKKLVEIRGTLSWDEDARVALYESITDSGITVWKLREFEEVNVEGAPATRVSERIEGLSPAWLKLIVQSETTKSHKNHMDLYHTLF